jgi:hypothetical protein
MKKSFHISVGSGHKNLLNLAQFVIQIWITVCIYDGGGNVSCNLHETFPPPRVITHYTMSCYITLHIMQWVYSTVSVACAVERIL